VRPTKSTRLLLRYLHYKNALTLLDVSTHKRPSRGTQTKAIPHKAKLTNLYTFDMCKRVRYLKCRLLFVEQMYK